MGRKKSILITGGCGFIGSNLIDRLLAKYDSVRVLDNLSVGKRESICADAELIMGDIRDEAIVSEAVAGVEVVIHLAAHTSVTESIELPRLSFDVNVSGTLNLLQQSVEKNVKKFILASSNAAVGEQEPPISETAVPAPLSPYGASKLSSEALCSAFAESYGLRTIALRFANVYGPRSDHKGSVIAEFFRRALSNQPIKIYGDGNQTRDFIYIDDICQAILLAIESDSVAGVFQIGNGSESRIIDLANRIRDITGSESSIVFEKSREGEIIRNYSCIEKARTVMGFEPRIGLDDGLAITYEWFMN